MYFWKYSFISGKDEKWYHESGKHEISPTFLVNQRYLGLLLWKYILCCPRIKIMFKRKMVYYFLLHISIIFVCYVWGCSEKAESFIKKWECELDCQDYLPSGYVCDVIWKERNSRIHSAVDKPPSILIALVSCTIR